MKLIKTSWRTSEYDGYVWVYGPETSDQKFCRGIFEAINFGRNCLNIPHTELSHALADCQKESNDVMEFGDINGFFLFSRKGLTDDSEE